MNQSIDTFEIELRQKEQKKREISADIKELRRMRDMRDTDIKEKAKIKHAMNRKRKLLLEIKSDQEFLKNNIRTLSHILKSGISFIPIDGHDVVILTDKGKRALEELNNANS